MDLRLLWLNLIFWTTTGVYIFKAAEFENFCWNVSESNQVLFVDANISRQALESITEEKGEYLISSTNGLPQTSGRRERREIGDV